MKKRVKIERGKKDDDETRNSSSEAERPNLARNTSSRNVMIKPKRAGKKDDDELGNSSSEAERPKLVRQNSSRNVMLKPKLAGKKDDDEVGNSSSEAERPKLARQNSSRHVMLKTKLAKKKSKEYVDTRSDSAQENEQRDESKNIPPIQQKQTKNEGLTPRPNDSPTSARNGGSSLPPGTNNDSPTSARNGEPLPLPPDTKHQGNVEDTYVHIGDCSKSSNSFDDEDSDNVSVISEPNVHGLSFLLGLNFLDRSPNNSSVCAVLPKKN